MVSDETPAGRERPAGERTWRSRTWGALRATAYVAVVSGCLVAWGVRGAQAKIGEEAMALGSTMMRMKIIDGQVNTMRINGETLVLSTAIVDAPVKEALDRFEGACNASQGVLGEVWRRIPKLGPRDLALLSVTGMNPGSNAMRMGDDKSGVVLCLADKDGGVHRTLVEALQSVVSTGELGRLGSLRYVFGRRGEENTQLMMLWSDSPLSMDKLTGGDGLHDVEGLDPVHIARPPDSLRTFSIALEGEPYSFNLYRSRVAADTILAAYDRTMSDDGWELLLGSSESEPGRRMYIRGMVMVAALVEPGQDGTTVSLLETSREGAPAPPHVAPTPG